jgi:hypothetical protein
MAKPARSVLVLVLAILLPFLGPEAAPAQPAAPASPPPAAGAWNPDAFPISFWCGPPENFVTPERFKQIADAGFTHAMPACGAMSPESNKKILDYCQAAGIKAFIGDSRLPHGFGPNGEGKERIDAIVKDYAAHPAFAGYFIGDEPGAGLFPALAQTVGYLREKDPNHVAYLNLYPNYCPPSGLGTPTYEAYVREFVKQVKPAIVSYDHYHFLTHSDRPGFFDNLDVVRRVSAETNLPFWQIVLSINHFDYRPLTEAEKRWEAMQTLAYGGKGVMYFTYWQPDASGTWGTAIINADGTPTKQYDEIKRINHDVQAIGRHLIKAKSAGVFEYGQPGDATHTGGTNPVRFDGPAITAGWFEEGSTRYALFANRDYRKPAKTDVFVTTGGQPLEKLDKATGKWSRVEASGPHESKVPLEIAAGDAELYRWQTRGPTTAPTEQKKY